jgi:mono/diheme cytochrome c family protein
VRPLVAGLVAAAVAFIAVALATAGDDPAGKPAPRPSSGAALFASMGCGSCHRLAAAGSDAELGPSLDERLPDHTRASLRAAILRPPTAGMMPADFASRMSAAELDTLVTYLLAAR